MVASCVYLAARDFPKGSNGSPSSCIARGGKDSAGGAASEDSERHHRHQRDGAIVRTTVPIRLTSEGFAILEGGACIGPLDAVIYCTGYRYSFPFLSVAAELNPSCLPTANGVGKGLLSDGQHPMIQVEDGRVEPLYLDIFPPAVTPGTLSFIGLPWKVVPFPQHELQAKLVARVLSGRACLPSRSEMENSIKKRQELMEAMGIPYRYYHMQGQKHNLLHIMQL